MYFHRLLVAAALCLLVAGVAIAQVSSTRVSDFDWQCADAAGVKISDHQRFDTAFVACLNAPNGAFVQGGRYRITRAAPTPEPVRSATLVWTQPTTNTDGTTLTNLAGYRISYGASATALTQTIQVANPGVKTFTVSDLAPGTWFFSVRAYTSNGTESAQSNVGSKVVL
jgi:hypothetical protein